MTDSALSRSRSLPTTKPRPRVYRACRRQGTTIRRLAGCLIAAVAMRTGSVLLHEDSDFDAIARHAPLSTLALR